MEDNDVWNLSHYLKVQNPLNANGYLKLRGIEKVMKRDIRYVLLLRALLKRKTLILKILSLRFQKKTLSEL